MESFLLPILTDSEATNEFYRAVRQMQLQNVWRGTRRTRLT
jgi:hypothetical protein